MKPEKLSPREQEILDLITARPGELTLDDIAELLGSTPGSIKVFIHRLRAQGHRITSPRFHSRKGPRKGLPQTYSIKAGA